MGCPPASSRCPCARASDAGELELDEDDELNLGQVTAEELQQEEQDEPDMMKNAAKWDNFLALEAEAKREWAKPEDDTLEYREQRAVDFFNAAGVRCAALEPQDLHADPVHAVDLTCTSV